ncbi:Endoplasmic reticulum chaperone BiP [Chamberlinius hualienensis]
MNSLCKYIFLLMVIQIAFVSSEITGPLIGIDLGTTYSSVAIWKDDHVEVIQNEFGNRFTPSYVSFMDDESILVGEEAMLQAPSNPKNTIYNTKRLIGLQWDDPLIQSEIRNLSFTIIEKDEKPVIQIQTSNGFKSFTPEEISAMILAKMKKIAEDYLGERVTDAVITVPAYFSETRRQATINAAQIAGLNVVKILNEPTAAALAYGIQNNINDKKTLLVFDVGGGTSEASILNIYENEFKVIGTSGDTHLGGEDYNQRLMNHLIELFKEKTKTDIRSSMQCMQKVRREAERAIRELSEKTSVEIKFENLCNGYEFSMRLTRANFEELNKDLFLNTIKLIKKVMKDAHLTPHTIDDILFVGGSSRIPKIRELLKNTFHGKKPIRGINPDEAVVIGAALQAKNLAIAEKNKVMLVDVYPKSLGVKLRTNEYSIIIPKNSEIPIESSHFFTTSRNNQDEVNIKIYEGESEDIEDNYFLCNLLLSNIPLAPEGIPNIKVTFLVDVNGILHVSAKDKKTNNIVNATITNRLPQEELKNMANRIETYLVKNKELEKQRKAIDRLEKYAYAKKEEVNKLGDKISKSDKARIEEVIDDGLNWLTLHQDAPTQDILTKIGKMIDVIDPIIEEASPKMTETSPRIEPIIEEAYTKMIVTSPREDL